MQITRIESIPRQPERVRVHLEGRYRAFELSRFVVEEAGLRPGAVVDETQLGKLLQRNDSQDALDRALHFLESRPRSEREVRMRLFQKGVAAELIDPVIE